MSAATEGADILREIVGTLLSRDADYKGSDEMLAAVMAALFPHGVSLRSSRDHHRFHLFMLAMVKVTRYARNWENGHDDSLRDLAAYSAMLLAIDRQGEPPGEQIGS
jgi:hypothetical protein